MYKECPTRLSGSVFKDGLIKPLLILSLLTHSYIKNTQKQEHTGTSKTAVLLVIRHVSINDESINLISYEKFCKRKIFPEKYKLSTCGSLKIIGTQIQFKTCPDSSQERSRILCYSIKRHLDWILVNIKIAEIS